MLLIHHTYQSVAFDRARITQFVLQPAAKLDPHRASRKFTEAKPLEDPNVEIKEKQAARLGRLSTFGAAEEVALEKKKAQRLDAAKQQEEKCVAFWNICFHSTKCYPKLGLC